MGGAPMTRSDVGLSYQVFAISHHFAYGADDLAQVVDIKSVPCDEAKRKRGWPGYKGQEQIRMVCRQSFVMRLKLELFFFNSSLA